MKKDFVYLKSFNSFCSEVADSIQLDNLSMFKNAMESKAYGSLEKNAKEFEAFKTVYQSFFLFGNSANLLNYLIFDYNISESNSIDKIRVDDSIKKMFENRNLKSELNIELKDCNEPIKRLKV